MWLVHWEKTLQKCRVAEEEEGAADESDRFWFSTPFWGVILMPVKQNILQVFLPLGRLLRAAALGLTSTEAGWALKCQGLKTAAVSAGLPWLKGVGRDFKNLSGFSAIPPLGFRKQVRHSCRCTCSRQSLDFLTFIGLEVEPYHQNTVWFGLEETSDTTQFQLPALGNDTFSQTRFLTSNSSVQPWTPLLSQMSQQTSLPVPFSPAQHVKYKAQTKSSSFFNWFAQRKEVSAALLHVCQSPLFIKYLGQVQSSLDKR